MSKRKKLDRRKANPDFRARNNMPIPPIEEIQRRISKSLTPNSFAAARMRSKELGLRERILTLPLMVCFVLSLVCRRIPSLSELLRVCEREGLFDFAPIKITKQSLSKRLCKLPAELFCTVFNEALRELQSQEQEIKDLAVSEVLDGIREKFPSAYIADGSTLEALRKRLKEQTDNSVVELGAKMMCLINLYTKSAVRAFYTERAKANDKSFIEEILGYLSQSSIIVFDTGFFSFQFFDQLTEQGKYFVTRYREKSAYKVLRVLSEGKFYRDEIVEFGVYRSNPCRNCVRMVSVL